MIPTGLASVGQRCRGPAPRPDVQEHRGGAHMPFTLIKGTFHVVGRSPDGDSVGFRAADPAHWALLDGPPPRLNSLGITQLRFEAIDALETHFRPPGQNIPIVLDVGKVS